MTTQKTQQEYTDRPARQPGQIGRVQQSETSQRPARKLNRGILALAAVIVLILAMGIVTYAARPSVFGWGGNFEVRDTGSGTEAYLHTSDLTDPAEIENGRLWFIVNGEHRDITEELSETDPYLYDFTDGEGIIHYWIVGKNGPEPENYGYGEFLYRPEEGWLGGYSARTDLDAEGKGPDWLQAGKAELGIPW